jgi:hypothetical protein
MDEMLWQQQVAKVAREHPEWLGTTIQAFTAGVKAQAYQNNEMTNNAYAALSAL